MSSSNDNFESFPSPKDIKKEMLTELWNKNVPVLYFCDPVDNVRNNKDLSISTSRSFGDAPKNNG